jgi:hypothetical protein
MAKATATAMTTARAASTAMSRRAASGRLLCGQAGVRALAGDVADEDVDVGHDLAAQRAAIIDQETAISLHRPARGIGAALEFIGHLQQARAHRCEMGIAGQARFQLVQLGEIDRLLFVDDLQFGLRIGVAEEDVGIAGSDTGLVQRLAGHVGGARLSFWTSLARSMALRRPLIPSMATPTRTSIITNKLANPKLSFTPIFMSDKAFIGFPSGVHTKNMKNIQIIMRLSQL